MDKTLVVFATRAGSSKVIARWIADALQCDIVPVSECKQLMINNVDNTIYVGGIRMNSIYKYKKFVSKMSLENKRLITVAVGMTYPEKEFIKHLAVKNHHHINANEHEFAYLQGAFDITKVKTKMERVMLNMLADSIDKKGAAYDMTKSEKCIVNCMNSPQTFMRTQHISPIVNLIDVEKSKCIPMLLIMEYDEEGNDMSAPRPCVLEK